MAEIDKLNRSRRAIKEYNLVKEEVEELKLTQKELREQRDLMFRVRSHMIYVFIQLLRIAIHNHYTRKKDIGTISRAISVVISIFSGE